MNNELRFRLPSCTPGFFADEVVLTANDLEFGCMSTRDSPNAIGAKNGNKRQMIQVSLEPGTNLAIL